MPSKSPKSPIAPDQSASAEKPKRPRGRPQYERTDEAADLIKMMVAFGHTKEECAAAIGISTSTMMKAYPVELRDGKSLIRGHILHLLWRNAKTGNVSAQKHIEVVTSGRGADGSLPYRLPDGAAAAKPAPEPEEKPEVLGKKAQKLKDARNPDTSSAMGALMAERHAAGKSGKVQ